MKRKIIVLMVSLVLLGGCQTFFQKKGNAATAESEATTTPTATIWPTLPLIPATSTPIAVAALYDLARAVNRGRATDEVSQSVEDARIKLIELADILRR